MTNPDQIIQQGMQALQQGQPAHAKELFTNLINSGVENASLWLAVAYANRDLSDHEGMLKAAEKSYDLENRNPRALVLKGDYYYQAQKQHSAASFYLKALNIAPKGNQIPPDLAPEIQRAQQRYQTITQSYQDTLVKTMDDAFKNTEGDARRVQIALDFILGKKQPYLQQPKNFYFPELPNVEFADITDYDWVEELEQQTDAIRDELINLINHHNDFKPYITGNKARSITDRHNLIDNDDWSALFLYQGGERQDTYADLCPNTMAALEKTPLCQAPGVSPNIMFSKLKAGFKIPPHNGRYNTRFICHLPLIVPEGCHFRVGNSQRQWSEGKLWVFDDSIEHEAWNDSDQDRYILLFDIWRPELSDSEKSLISTLISSLSD